MVAIALKPDIQAPRAHILPMISVGACSITLTPYISHHLCNDIFLDNDRGCVAYYPRVYYIDVPLSRWILSDFEIFFIARSSRAIERFPPFFFDL